MANVVQVTKTIKPVVRSKDTAAEEKYRERVIKESRDQYRTFLDSINRSSDREIERALKHA